MTYSPAQPPAPAYPSVPAPAAKRGLPWWGWALLGAGLLGIVLTAVFYAQAVTALVGGANPGPAAPGFGQEQEQDEPEDPEASGVLYESADFPFEVTFPGEPTRDVIEQPVAGFDIELIMVTWSGGGRNVILGSTLFPADLLPAGGPNDDVLQGSLDGAAANVGGIITAQEFTEVDGQRAITGTFTASGSTLYATVFFRDSVQYSLISENGSAAEHEDYVGGFRFTD